MTDDIRNTDDVWINYDFFLVKAQSKATGKWVIGNIVSTFPNSQIVRFNEHLGELEWTEIHDGTIKRCTGRLDIAKKLIFEGDFITLGLGKERYEICWSENDCWVLVSEETGHVTEMGHWRNLKLE